MHASKAFDKIHFGKLFKTLISKKVPSLVISVPPLCAILKEHNIGYHIYADDTQLYISFNSKEPLTSLTKLNNCISDIRVWMIKNKLKINDSKTEFIIFRSPLLKTDLSGVSIRVGDSQISSSSKVRDLGFWVLYLTIVFH